MNLTLKRTDHREDGIFGVLLDDKGNQIAVTLEHSYDSMNGDGSYTSKIPNGTYTCIRGEHCLHINSPKFSTFEITGVKGHSGILFHKGNVNIDSNGCVLLGKAYGGEPRMLYNSRITFDKFLLLQDGVNSFILTVE